jgi:hypothetical protein
MGQKLRILLKSDEAEVSAVFGAIDLSDNSSLD